MSHHSKIIRVEIYDSKTKAVVVRKGLTPKEFEKFRKEFSERYEGMDWRMASKGEKEASHL